MKHALFLLLALTATLVFAQSETVTVEPFGGGGVALGVPGGDPSLTLHGGADNLLGPLALRGVFSIDFSGVASVGADIIDYFPISRTFAPYAGAGAALALTFPAYELHVLGGVEYFLDEDIALFVELQPAYRIFATIDNGFGANMRLGANYHFD